MHIIFDHRLGFQERYDLQFTQPVAVVEPHEESDALEQGWLLDDNGTWYQSRSTRLVIDDYLPHPPKVKFEVGYDNDEEIDRIYHTYLAKKGLADLYNPLKVVQARDTFIGYLKDDVLVGFTKLRCYNEGNVESNVFCWDYADPSLHLGYTSIGAEAAFVKERGGKCLYVGSGYEESSAYKADLPNFEWWTGNEWSHDGELYRRLCARDSATKTFSDIRAILETPEDDIF